MSNHGIFKSAGLIALVCFSHQRLGRVHSGSQAALKTAKETAATVENMPSTARRSVYKNAHTIAYYSNIKNYMLSLLLYCTH